MDAFHVVIDTSVLRKAHFQHADFKRLLRLSQKGVIKIYIPHIVLEEERTHRLQSLTDDLGKIHSNLRGLIDGGLSMLVEGLPTPIVEIWTADEVTRNSRAVFEKFLSDNKIVLIETSHQQAEGVLRRYFEILPPFDPMQLPRTKRREDIPDAWVLEAALEVKSRKGRHCALVEDGKLKAALESEKFEVFSNVNSFVEVVEIATATVLIGEPEPKEAPVQMDQLRAALKGVDVIVLGMNEALKSPSKEKLFDTLESVGVTRQLAEHEAKTLVLLGIVIDTGSHLIPTNRGVAEQAAQDSTVQELLLKVLG